LIKKEELNVEVFEIVEYHMTDIDCPIPVDTSASTFFSFIKTIKRLSVRACKFVGQMKRNVENIVSDGVSLICKLIKSTNQNYRIDCSLETPRTMTGHQLETDCSEARIKSHIAYIRKNCMDRVKYITDGKSFCFQAI
jgi:hypothetical protein